MLRIFCIISLAMFLFSCAGINFVDDGEYPDELKKGARKTQQKKEAPPQRLTAPDEEATLGPTPKSAAQTVRDENLSGPGGASTNPRDSLARTKTKSQIIFTGSVATIDPSAQTISIKSTGKNLTFELRNPVLRGYSRISDIKVGDVITLAYIRNGIGIVKGENFHEDLREQTVADDLSPSRPKGKQSKQTVAKLSNNRSAPIRVKYKVNRLTFDSIDNNKDGKISPVELSAVMPSITMEDFKKYDRNGDGYLDSNEYKSVRK